MTVFLALLALLPTACQARAAPPSEERLSAPSATLAPSARAAPAGPIRMEPLDAQAKPPMFVMRGEPRGPARLVFLHGMCGHGLGYAHAFQWNAAKKGTLIAPQADISCGGVFSKWSMDVAALDARILEAFRALGETDDSAEITIMGMSQGADRAVQLAKRYPQRYTRLVSMAAPSVVNPAHLRALRRAVIMAGERDRRDLAQASARALTASGIRSTFMLIPQATHGAMGPTPEKTMGEVLDWLWAE
mgnify:FL=1